MQCRESRPKITARARVFGRGKSSLLLLEVWKKKREGEGGIVYSRKAEWSERERETQSPPQQQMSAQDFQDLPSLLLSGQSKHQDRGTGRERESCFHLL